VLQVEGLDVVYNDAVLALRDVTLEAPRGSIVTLLGANGAGKTTVLRAVSGLLPVHGGAIAAGSVRLDGVPIPRLSAAAVVDKGVAQVLEGRRIFGQLTVEENLRVGAHTARRDLADNMDRVFGLFPQLAERRRHTAGYLSGGEQQMLAMGRALMSNPALLLLDEPSLGLAPLLVQQIRDLIVEINRQGTTVLLVEQNATMALSIAHHGYLLDTGRIAMHKPAAAMLADDDIREFYLGLRREGTHSFRDVRYRRRGKRWMT